MAWKLLDEETPSEIPTNSKLHDIADSTRRGIARTGSNLATRAIGLPGDILSLSNEFIARPITKAATGSSIPYEETALGKAIPTTATHRRNLESITGDYLKPQSEVEQLFDDVVEDTALLFTPGGKAAKSATQGSKLFKSFATSVGGNLAGEAVESATGSKGAKDLTKLGAFSLTSLLSRPTAQKMISSLYKQAESNLPKDAVTSAKKLEDNLVNLGLKVSEGTLAPSEKFVLDEANAVLKKINDGKISVSEAWASKRSLNEKLQDYIFKNPERKAQARARMLATVIQKDLSQTIEQYGKTNPSFYKPYKDAEEAFGAMAKSNFISNFVSKNVKSSPVTHGLLHLFGGPIGSTASAAVVPYQATKLGYRIMKSPTLRKHYAGALKAASKDNAKVFNKYLNELDEGIQKEESKERWEFVD